MKTSHWFQIRLAIIAMACGALTSGCMLHLLSSGEQTPAQILVYPGAPPVHDRRVRFRQIVCDLAGQIPSGAITHVDCTHLLWRLADEKEPASPSLPLPSHDPHLRLLIVPGAFAQCFPEFGMPFEDAAASLRKRGYRIDFIPVSGRSGADHNAGQIAEAVNCFPKNRPTGSY